MKTDKPTKLTAKQEIFCREYLVSLNATQAAISAGYSEKTAQRMGSENLSKPLIAERIRILFGERSKRVELNAEWVLLKAKESFEVNAAVFENENGATEMVNAAAAGKFLDMCGKHVDVQAFVNKVEAKLELTDDFGGLMLDASND